MSVINLGAWFGWRGSADTDLRFNEFFAADHTVMARFMPQYPIASVGPILAENGSGTYFVGQGDFLSNPEGTKLMLSVGNQSQVYLSTLGHRGYLASCRRCSVGEHI